MSRRAWFIIAALVAAVAVTLWLSQQQQQPRYAGHPLSYWVRSLALPKTPGSHRLAEAAVRAAGTNAIPYLVNWIQKEHPGRLATAYDKLLWKIKPSLYFSHASGFEGEGAAIALRILGPEAKDAIPALTKIMNDTERYTASQRAAATMPYLGAEALPPLAAVITNQPYLGHYIINHIYLMGTNARPAVPLLLRILNDKQDIRAAAAADALGKLTLEPDSVVPALTSSLEDPRQYVGMAAAEALLRFESPPPAAHAYLLSLLTNSDPDVRLQATNALRRAANAPPR